MSSRDRHRAAQLSYQPVWEDLRAPQKEHSLPSETSVCSPHWGDVEGQGFARVVPEACESCMVQKHYMEAWRGCSECQREPQPPGPAFQPHVS